MKPTLINDCKQVGKDVVSGYWMPNTKGHWVKGYCRQKPSVSSGKRKATTASSGSQPQNKRQRTQ